MTTMAVISKRHYCFISSPLGYGSALIGAGGCCDSRNSEQVAAAGGMEFVGMDNHGLMLIKTYPRIKAALSSVSGIRRR